MAIENAEEAYLAGDNRESFARDRWRGMTGVQDIGGSLKLLTIT